MKPVLKVNFVDEFSGFKPEDEYVWELMQRDYEVEISPNPDYLFCSTFGQEHLKYDCVKILITGENQIPDFNLYDYAIGFDPIIFGDRYLRMPLFPFYKSFRDRGCRNELTDRELLGRGFCSFVVSNNNGDPLREEFFHRLSEYKQVSSGGRFLNNVGGPVDDKLKFCAQFKFNIAFENSAAPGYTTEKVMEAIEAQSMPIYYGNPFVEEDINPDSLVLIRSREDVAKALDEIIYLDTHDDEYLRRIRSQPYVHPDKSFYDKRMLDFLKAIFSQPKSVSKRVIRYGRQQKYRERLIELERVHKCVCGPVAFLRKFIRF